MNNSKGSALILVILVVSLLSLLVVVSSDRLTLSLKNSATFSTNTQSYWFAMAIESSATNFLQSVKRIDQTNYIGEGNLITNRIDANVDGVNIQGYLRDLNSCFNLNLLVKKNKEELIRNEEAINIFKSLLLNLNIDEFSSSEILPSLLDWLDSNDFTEDANGAEDDFYTRLDAPYKTSNQLIFDLYELLNIKGFDKKLVQSLESHICVIPNDSKTKFNLNSISKNNPELLSAFFENQISLSEASQILLDRPIDGFKDKEEFWSHPSLENIKRNNNIDKYLSFSSNYFELETKVSNPMNSYKMTSVLYINKSNNISVVKRHLSGI